MDCATEVSPTASVSPPISPLKYVHRTTSSSLPPLKNLPTWSRTSLEGSKHSRRLMRDTTEIHHGRIVEENASRSTQTSPSIPTTKTSAQAILVSNVGKDGHESLVKTLEKKLAFVQTQYEDVLSRLREEVGALKRDNMELTFKLVMQNGNLPCHPDLTDSSTTPMAIPESPIKTTSVAVETLPEYQKEKEELQQAKVLNELKIITMDKELRALRQCLQEARDQNAYLLGLVEKQKQRQRLGTRSAKLLLDGKTRQPQGNMGHQPVERILPHRLSGPLPPVDVAAANQAEDVTHSDSLPTSVQHGPLDSLMSNKPEHTNEHPVSEFHAMNEEALHNYPFPYYEPSNVRSGNKNQEAAAFKYDLPIKKGLDPLPRLTVGVTGRSTKYRDTHRTEVVPLPAIRVPAGSLVERQRRAHALHVQRQKSNREFTLFKLM